MLKMKQPTISFISSSSSTNNDEMVIENDEPEEMEKLEYSESDDEDLSGTKNVEPSSIEDLNSMLTNSNIEPVNNGNVEDILNPKTIVTVLDRLKEGNHENPHNILELKEKPDPSPNYSNNNMLFELATQKLNLDDDCLAPKTNADDKMLGENNTINDKPELVNIENSKDCPALTHFISKMHDDDKTMTESTISDAELTQIFRPEVSIEDASLDNTNISGVTDSISQNQDDCISQSNDADNIFLKATQIFNPRHNDDDEDEGDIFLQTTQVFHLNNDDDSISRPNNAENDDLDKTKMFPVDDDFVENDRLLNQIDEAISISEGGDTNSMMENDSQTSVTDETEDSKSKPETDGSNADDSFGKLMIDENNETDNEISNEQIETETINPGNLELEESLIVTPNIEATEKITEPSNQQPDGVDGDDEMNGIQENLTADDEFISVQQFDYDDDDDKMNGVEEEDEDLLLHDEFIPKMINQHSIDDDQMTGVQEEVLPTNAELISEAIIEQKSNSGDQTNDENKDEIPNICSEVIEHISGDDTKANEIKLGGLLARNQIISKAVVTKSDDEKTNNNEADDLPACEDIISEATEQRSNDVVQTNEMQEGILTSNEFVSKAPEQRHNDDTQMNEIGGDLAACDEIIPESVDQQADADKITGDLEKDTLPTNEIILESINQIVDEGDKMDGIQEDLSTSDEIADQIIEEPIVLENGVSEDVVEKDLDSAVPEIKPIDEEPKESISVESETPKQVSEASETPANVDDSNSELEIASKEIDDEVSVDNTTVETSKIEEVVEKSSDVENNLECNAGDEPQFEEEINKSNEIPVIVDNLTEELSPDECSVGILTIATVETVELADKLKSIDDESPDEHNQDMEIQNETDLNQEDQEHTVVEDDGSVAESIEKESVETELESKNNSRKRTLSPDPTNDKTKKPRISTEELIKVLENNNEESDIRKSLDDSSNEENNDITDDVEMQELQEEKDDFVEDDDDDDTDDDKPLSSIKSPHSQRPSIDSIEEGEDRKSKFSEISKTMEETSEDIPEEPTIKSIPKNLPFLKKFKQELTNFTTDELEELVLQKIVEALVCKSHISQLQEKVDKQEEVINSVRSKFNELSKLYKDLEMVHLRVLRDMDIKNEGYIVPVRITRAVGLQVTQDPKGKFTQTETTVKNLIDKNARICYKPVEIKALPATSTPSQSILISSVNNSTTSTSTTITSQNAGEIKKPRTVQKFTPMRPQLTPAQHLQIQKQTQQEKQLLLQQQKQKILLQKQQQQQQQQPIQTPHQQTMQQKIAQSQQNIQRQQAAMQAQQQQQPQQRSPPTTSISLKNGQMIVSRPVNGLSVTTTTPSSLIIKKAVVPTRVVPTQSSPSSMANIVTAATSAIVSSTTTTASTPVAATPPKSVIDLTDEEDIKVPETTPANKVNVLNGQPPALVAIPGQKGVNKLTYVIRNPTNNNKILVHNVPPAQNRVTLQKVPGTPNRYGMSKSEVNRLYYLTHRTRLLMRRKERHTRNKQTWNHLSPPELTIAPKHGGPGVKPATTPQTGPTVTPVVPSTSERTTVSATNSLQPRLSTHPAPLPNPPTQESDPSWKRIPPRPIVRIQNSNAGIVISWSLDSTRGGYATIESYQIYAYQETPAPPATDSWRHVGDVKSMLLPMAVTLTHFEEGRRYFFAVRAVDEHNRVGVFSLPKTW